MDGAVPDSSTKADHQAEEAPLFRPEVFASHSSQWLGAIRLAQPVSGLMIVAATVAIGVCLIAFLTFGSVTKKARVAGITVPTQGSLSIMAPNAGVLVRSHIKEGQHVAAGQTLFELSTERQGSNGEITALVSQQLLIRQQTLASERRLRIAQSNDKKRVIDERLMNLSAESSQMEQEIALAQRRQGLAQKSLASFQTLQSNGFVSAAQTQQKQEDLIDLDARLSNLLRQKVQLQATRLSLVSEQNALASSLATDLAQLQRADASLNQEVAENQNRKATLITAPQAGVMTTITYQPGQAVNAGQALATFIPGDATPFAQDNKLEVHLYAPSRAAGFVAVGQKVLIRYQSYPYQKFGLQEGIVADVSKTPFAPGELPGNLASTILSNAQQTILGFNGNEGLYRVKVRLRRQTIAAYGQEQVLKPGMTLDADIVQDKRKIWEWVAEPVLAVAQR
jgi:membrane fusion protein